MILLLGTAQSPEGAGRDWSVELSSEPAFPGKGAQEPEERRCGLR